MKKLDLKNANNGHYYLGTDGDGYEYYLQVPSWDCGWYWGFGYIQGYKYGRFQSHEHFDSLFLKGGYMDAFKEKFVTTPLTESKIWQLMDYMKSFYTLKVYAELLKHGNSYISGKADPILQNTVREKEINDITLPWLFTKIDELFED